MDDTILQRFAAVLDRAGLVTDASDMAPYVTDHRELYTGSAGAVLRPRSTDEVAAVIGICAEAHIAVVPQGGNTGLVGGSIPDDSGTAVVLNLGRMNRIRELDPVNDTLTAEAGCVLADLQAAAEAADRLFPLSLGAEGSCMIGGNLATNAGGVQVLKYGNTRELTLGLEVVLPDGRVWNGLTGLRKDNTGYDLKQLFIGSEGTLGVITAAVMKLFPRPAARETAWLAVPKLDDVLALLGSARAASGDTLTAFELIPRIGVELVVKHFEGMRAPVETVSPWYVLMEWSGGVGDSDSDGTHALRRALEAFLADRFEAGVITDAALATSEAQAAALWKFREVLPESQTREGGSIKHDVSVAVSRIPEFMESATRELEAHMAGIRVFPFGHAGDGNIHFNVTAPKGMDTDAFYSQWEAINRIVHDRAMAMEGSFSAEHGIGQLKLGELSCYGSAEKLDLMARLKAAIDPTSIMNPGKVLAAK